MSVDVGRCFPRPLPRTRGYRHRKCAFDECKRGAGAQEEYCWHHRGACLDCGTRITETAKRCATCAAKNKSGMNGLIEQQKTSCPFKSKPLSAREQIEEMIQAYQDRIAAKRDDAEFCKKRVAELQAQLRVMDKA